MNQGGVLAPYGVNKSLCMTFSPGHKDDESVENNVVHIHWRLVRNVSRSEGIKEWQRTAVKVLVMM